LTAEFISLHQWADTAALRKSSNDGIRWREDRWSRSASGALNGVVRAAYVEHVAALRRPRRASIMGAPERRRPAKPARGRFPVFAIVQHDDKVCCLRLRSNGLATLWLYPDGDHRGCRPCGPHREGHARGSRGLCQEPHTQEGYCNALKLLNAPQPAAVPAYRGRTRIADTKRRSQNALPHAGTSESCHGGGYSACPGQRHLRRSREGAPSRPR
jgi:hypothetical protein